MISGQSLLNKNCDNSRPSSDIDLKLGPVTKLNIRNTTTPQKFDDDIIFANYGVIIIMVDFIANLGQSGSRIPNAWFVKSTFS